MIKTIIFDLDGVLLKAKKYITKLLNENPPVEYRISYEEHLSSMILYLLNKN